MASATINVTGMTCGGCTKSIENALDDEAGIHRVVADLDAGTVVVNFDDNIVQQSDIERTIKKIGFAVTA